MAKRRRGSRAARPSAPLADTASQEAPQQGPLHRQQQQQQQRTRVRCPRTKPAANTVPYPAQQPSQALPPVARRRRSPRHHQGSGYNEGDDTSLSIEEQLKRQRRAAQKQRTPKTAGDDDGSLSVAPSNPNPPPRALGGYVYDEERKTYFPKGSVVAAQSVKSSHCSISAISTTTGWQPHSAQTIQSSPAVYPLLVQQCTSQPKRCRLVARWGASIVLNSIGTDITNQQHPLRNSFRYPLTEWVQTDASRKRQLPPWAQTFTVNVDYNSKNANQGHEISQVELVSLMDDGALLARFDRSEGYSVTRRSVSSSWDEKTLSLKACQVPSLLLSAAGDSREGTAVYGLLSTGEQDSIVRNMNTGALLGSVKGMATSFTVLNDSFSIVVAVQQSHNSKNHRTILSEIRGHDYLRHSLAKAPRSDVLCIEPLSSDRTVVLGHRNGQVSLSDFRVAAIALSTKANVQLAANVSSIHVLQHRPYQVLTRNSSSDISSSTSASGNCLCRLWDIRKMGGSYGDNAALSSSYDKDPSLVREFYIPSGCHHSLLTSRCSGMATDLVESVLLAPFVERKSGTTNDNGPHVPRIGVWSLHTGEYVGSRILTGDGKGGTSHPIVELSGKITRAFDMASQDLVPACSGVWYKLVDLKDTTTVRAPSGPILGNIHQVVLNGRFSE